MSAYPKTMWRILWGEVEPIMVTSETPKFVVVKDGTIAGKQAKRSEHQSIHETENEAWAELADQLTAQRDALRLKLADIEKRLEAAENKRWHTATQGRKRTGAE